MFVVDCFFLGFIWHVEVRRSYVEDETYQILGLEKRKTYKNKFAANMAAKQKFRAFASKGDVLFLQS
jgi:hypothetical protein